MVMVFDAPLERVWASWRDPRRLADAFEFLESVENGDDTVTLHYRGVFGKRRDLELYITEEVDERCLAWRGESTSLNVTGSLMFAPKGAQTYVTFVLGWRPPLGRVGDIIGGWIGYPRKPLRQGLARFEELARQPLETSDSARLGARARESASPA
jgi:uncharacterized membrane protein